MKTCATCENVLDSTRKTYCEVCRKKRAVEAETRRYERKKNEILAQKREYRANNPDKIKETKRKNYQKNRNKIIERQKQYYSSNSIKIREYQKSYRDLHKDELAEKAHDRYMHSKEDRLEYLKDYRDKNREELRKKDRDRYQEPGRKVAIKVAAKKLRSDPDKKRRYLDQIIAHRHKRRAAEGTYTVYQLVKLIGYTGKRCLRCGSPDNIQVDHIQPLSRGGTNWITNLQPLCKSCNTWKMTKTIDYRDATIRAYAETLMEK